MRFRATRVFTVVSLSLAVSFASCSDDPSGLDPELSRQGLATGGASVFPSVLQPTTVAGKTPTSFNVSNTGSPSYRIPLWTPPGIGPTGVSLSLVYGAQNGSGLLGVGWSLSGLSSISRCKEGYQTHGRPRAVALEATDRFCLDGQPLQLIRGTYGQADSVYGTEKETFSRVTAMARRLEARPRSRSKPKPA